jgi:hypothetical protein
LTKRLLCVGANIAKKEKNRHAKGKEQTVRRSPEGEEKKKGKKEGEEGKQELKGRGIRELKWSRSVNYWTKNKSALSLAKLGEIVWRWGGSKQSLRVW